ncbi:TGS domain-containing protein [Candidatus Pacearchaeota archaeon]|nr:TGS domain-containing protein [Candidatus Pacearchaeota archaeon]
MASTNQSPFYKKAEENFLNAQTDEERLYFLEEMIKECPKHKSSEKMLANLKTRRIKLIEKIDRIKKSKKGGKSRKDSIKKADMQAVLIGIANSGKSSLLTALTNAKPIITGGYISTILPEVGMMDYEDIKVQIIENPPINSEYFDIGIANSADTLIYAITSIKEIEEIEKSIPRAVGKRIIAFSKCDLLSENEKRKISETLKSKRVSFVLISQITKEGIEELKEKIFHSFNKIRVYTKEPGKSVSKEPIIMPQNTNIKDIAEKIKKGLSEKIKEARITGPSSKFPNQIVSISHILKDKDIVEFKFK